MLPLLQGNPLELKQDASAQIAKHRNAADQTVYVVETLSELREPNGLMLHIRWGHCDFNLFPSVQLEIRGEERNDLLARRILHLDRTLYIRRFGASKYVVPIPMREMPQFLPDSKASAHA
jgi:hypothetical protein